MASELWFALPPIGALMLLVGSSLAAPAPQTDHISMRFETFGPARLHVLTTRMEIDEVGDRYAIVSDMTTRGLASVVVDGTSHAEARGRLTAAAAQPEAYREETRRNGVERRNHVEYGAGGVVIGGSIPPSLEPVPAAAARGTVDVQTAYFLVERQLARDGHCALTVPVFDGRHRFDLHFADAGREVLAPAAGQQFSGATIACRIAREDIAGYASEAEKSEGVERGIGWYGRLSPGDLMVPVRLELVTELGAVSTYLAELHGRGVDLRLMD